MQQVPTRLGQILLAQNTITKKQLAHALDFQALHNQPIGYCLITLGYIEDITLRRALRRQTWLKPCAACLTCICGLFTFTSCFANEEIEDTLNVDWIEQHDPYNSWSGNTNISGNTLSGVNFVQVAVEAAWGIYRGEPEAGEWQYSLSKKSTGYAISMQVHF